jgi:hypothetical protein
MNKISLLFSYFNSDVNRHFLFQKTFEATQLHLSAVLFACKIQFKACNVRALVTSEGAVAWLFRCFIVEPPLQSIIIDRLARQ